MAMNRSRESTDVEALVKSFVSDELSTLENAAGRTDSIELSPSYLGNMPNENKDLPQIPNSSPRFDSARSIIGPGDARSGPLLSDPSPRVGPGSFQSSPYINGSGSTPQVPSYSSRRTPSTRASEDTANSSKESLVRTESRKSSFGSKFKTLGRRITSGSKK